MAAPIPQSKAEMDPIFEARLRDLMGIALQEFQARSLGNQVRWQRPKDWSGDIFDPESMATPFDRSASNADYISAVANALTPGTTGDVVVTTTVIDYLSAMERAFHARFTRRPRAMSHMLGRKQGQSGQQGVFIQNGLEYIRSLLKQAKAPQP